MILKSILEVSDKDIKSFSCGNESLDLFLHRHALFNDKAGYGKTFVLFDKKEAVGFITLCSAQVEFNSFPKSEMEKLPRYPIPSIRIARLAVSKSKQGKGIGKELLKQSFIKALYAAMTVGIKLIIVDAKETSKGFYEKYGFIKLLDNESTYFLPIDVVAKAFLEKKS